MAPCRRISSNHSATAQFAQFPSAALAWSSIFASSFLSGATLHGAPHRLHVVVPSVVVPFT
jgi:hypothetical protein